MSREYYCSVEGYKRRAAAQSPETSAQPSPAPKRALLT